MSEATKARLYDWAFLVLRLSLGLTFMAHGAQKLFPVFGGPFLPMMAQSLAKSGLHPPMLWALMSALAEFGGGLLVTVGLLTRFGGLAIVINMIVAILLVHLKNGWWLSNRGYEYNLVLISIGLALMIAGAGRFSIDRMIRWKW